MTRLTDNELETLLDDLESDRAERKEAWAGDSPERGSHDRWAARIPGVYRESVLSDKSSPPMMTADPLCLARLKHYRSLVPMAQEARKPIFQLTAADGAIGSHSYGVQEARKDFYSLAQSILDRMASKS